jgi:hypothetical protein
MIRKTAILLALLLTACSTEVYRAPELHNATSDKTAALHVIRKASPWGAIIPAPVYVDHVLIGKIASGGQLDLLIPEGKRSVLSTTNEVTIDAKSGMEYYVEVTMPVQIWLVNPDFDVSIIDKPK